jgi:hypothetical protein
MKKCFIWVWREGLCIYGRIFLQATLKLAKYLTAVTSAYKALGSEDLILIYGPLEWAQRERERERARGEGRALIEAGVNGLLLLLLWFFFFFFFAIKQRQGEP